MEQWKPVQGLKDKYEVSNTGKVRSLITNKILKTYSNNGRRVVSLSTDGKSKNKMVHHLVAGAFIPNPHNCKYVKHKDHDWTNNHVDNLYWSNTRGSGKPTFISMKDLQTQRELQIWSSIRSISVWFRTNRPNAGFKVTDFRAAMYKSKRFSMYGYSWELL